jgi:hypothetical protein
MHKLTPLFIQDPRTTQWYEVGDAAAREKVGQQLRDCLRSAAHEQTRNRYKGKIFTSSWSSSSVEPKFNDGSLDAASQLSVNNEDGSHEAASQLSVNNEDESLLYKVNGKEARFDTEEPYARPLSLLAAQSDQFSVTELLTFLGYE